jgi:hypothetical protein
MASPWHKLRKAADHLTEAQLDGLRGAIALLILAGLAGAGYKWARPPWQRWQNHRALAQAEIFAKKGDIQNLMLALRRATALEPGDLATWQETARLLAQIGSPDSVAVRQQLVRLSPQDPALRLALARDALQLGRFDAAETAMDGMDEAGRRDLAFHRLAAGLAAALGRDTDLEREAKAIRDADPADANAQFAYAALRIWSPEAPARAEARAELERLLAAPAVRIRAAIQLLSAVSRQGGPAQVQAVLVELLHAFAPGAAPDFSAPEVPAWNAILEGMKAAAAPVPGDAALMVRWIAGLGRWPEALAWSDSLPPAVRHSPPVADAAAEVCAQQGELSRLGALLRAGAWGSWPEPAQELALAARLQALHFSPERGRETWKDAITACGSSATGLRNLARLAGLWHDPPGEEQVLAAVLTRSPKAFWAYSALRGLYLARRDLPALWDLYGRWHRQMPGDPAIAAAWVTLGAVLDKGDARSLALAGQMHQRFPDSLPAAVADAAALWRHGQAQAAWALLDALPEAARLRPDVSYWVTVIRAELGDRSGALAALPRALPGAASPDERTLLRTALSKVGYSLGGS